MASLFGASMQLVSQPLQNFGATFNLADIRGLKISIWLEGIFFDQVQWAQGHYKIIRLLGLALTTMIKHTNLIYSYNSVFSSTCSILQGERFGNCMSCLGVEATHTTHTTLTSGTTPTVHASHTTRTVHTAYTTHTTHSTWLIQLIQLIHLKKRL